MSNNKLKFLYQISSLRFFIITLVVTAFSFNFLDIFIFQVTRSFHELFFTFFSKIIDPLSDVLDPILKKKIEFIKKGLLKIDENFIL